MAAAARDADLREALAAEAAPLFFKWQRGEASCEDRLSLVETVKRRFPKA